MSSPSDNPFAAPASPEDAVAPRSWMPGRWTRFVLAMPFIIASNLLENGWVAVPGVLLLSVHRVSMLWRYVNENKPFGDFFED